jgi:monoamine oxidase
MYLQLAKRVGRFTPILDFPVQKLEYARKTSTRQYFNFSGRHRRCVELSDSCRVTSENGTSFNCDFVVSAVPLGVLKESVRDNAAAGPKIEFDPPLPVPKIDAIQSVGFGLLDKIYLQFPFAFWRGADGLQHNETQFGNASGVNPHHYIFYDMGKILKPAYPSHRGDPPAILMTLVSGREAAQSECLSEEEIVEETMETLRTLFGQVPVPIKSLATRWGRDRFSRGSYTCTYFTVVPPIYGGVLPLISYEPHPLTPSSLFRLLYAKIFHRVRLIKTFIFYNRP